MSVLVSILVTGGIGYFAWVADVPVEVWVTQGDMSRIEVRCWKGEDVYYDTLTTEAGDHGHMLPAGEWECRALDWEEDLPFLIRVLRKKSDTR